MVVKKEGNKASRAKKREIETDLLPRLDRLPWSRWHLKVAFALGFAWMLVALQASIVSSVLGILMKEWDFTVFQGSLTVSVWLIGIMIGAVIIGYLSDRYGRKKLFILTLVWYMGWTVVAAFSMNIWFFIFVRFMAALGIGGEYAAISAAAAEFMPKEHRGKINAFILSMWPVGAFLSALLVAVAVKIWEPNLAWRAGFLMAALFALFALYIRTAVPDTPRWLLDKRRYGEAEKVVSDIEDELKLEKKYPKLPPVEPIRIKVVRRGTWQLTKELVKKYPGRVMVGSSLNFAQVAIGYGSIAYAALVLFPMTSTPPEVVPTYFMVAFIFTFLGGMTSMLMVDWIGRRPTAFFSYASMPIAAISMAFPTTPALALASLCFLQWSNGWSWVTEYVLKMEIYPTRSRAAGVGWATFFGRIGGIIAAPILTGAYQGTSSALPPAIALAVIVSPGWIAALGWWKWGVEGKGKALEEIV